MQIFTFFSSDFKENLIFKEFVLLYSPFRLKYDHFYIGQTPIEEGYNLVITKDKVKINDQKVIIIEEINQNEIEKSVLIYKKFKKYSFTCNLKEKIILINGKMMVLEDHLNNVNSQPSNTLPSDSQQSSISQPSYNSQKPSSNSQPSLNSQKPPNSLPSNHQPSNPKPSNSQSSNAFKNYPIQNLITSPSPNKPTNDSSLSDLIKSKIKEILSEDTQVESIFRKLKMINKIN